MPLYIDLHVDSNLTPELIRQCHVADKALQDKYGVRYLQILLNQPQGFLFCLVEGPDKESCARVHQEAHGSIACNILEITESDFSALLANKSKDESDFTRNYDGTLDTGTRTLLFINLISSPQHYPAVKEIIKVVFNQHKGRTGESFGTQLVAVFESLINAIEASCSIRNALVHLPVEVRMGIGIGPPLQQKGDFFEDVRKAANRFSFFSHHGQVTLSSKALQLYDGPTNAKADDLKIITPGDEKLINDVMDFLDRAWNTDDITMESFARELGVSKSQLTRKMNALTGLSPNDFLKEYRLRRSISLMENESMNVAEITMAVGWTNPSYFAKCFRKRFGKPPSDYLKNRTI